MTTFNSGVPVNAGDASINELVFLEEAKLKILKAMAKGANVVAELEIRGRIVKHRDLPNELREIEALIASYKNKASGRNLRPARTQVRLRR